MPDKLKKLYLNAGQMKAGTTYLYSILKQHRNVYFSPEKEIHYLSQQYGPFRILSDAVRMRKAKSLTETANRLDRPIAQYRRVVSWASNYLLPVETEGWYENMFEGHRDDQWCADFSNLTCTIPVEGLMKVRDLADDVRVTYCVRDPASRAISHAKFHLRFAGQEHDLASLPSGALRDLLLSDNIYPQSRSEDHIGALHKVFGNEGLRIIRCETLWSDPRQVVDPLCDFLGIAPIEHEIKSEAVNVGPPSVINAQVNQIVDEVFGPLRERHDAMLREHSDIVLG